MSGRSRGGLRPIENARGTTHDRPYRVRRPVNEAIGEIIACSGKQFSRRDAAEALTDDVAVRAAA